MKFMKRSASFLLCVFLYACGGQGGSPVVPPGTSLVPMMSPTGMSTASPASTPSAISPNAVLAMPPVSCCDGVYTQNTIQGRQVWSTSPQYRYLYFRFPAALKAVAGQPVYVAVTYADLGYGLNSLQYDSAQGVYTNAEVHTRSSLVNSGGFAVMYAKLQAPSLQHRENGSADFRIVTPGNLNVAQVALQTTPFLDAGFQAASATPWLTPILTRTQPAADATTLQGAVMAGYQGWFLCPNDLADEGWSHWTTNASSLASQYLYVDQWPDMTAYPQSAYCRADALTLQNGQPAYAFSSTNLNVVEQHFAWMQENNIDGVYLQRFLLQPAQQPGQQWALANVRRAAADHGRIWAIGYDVSGLTDSNVLQTVESDWKTLVGTDHILQDASYAHEKGKPVVVIYGYSTRAGLTPTTGDALVDFFKNDPVYGGNYVIGTIWTGWPTVYTTWKEHFTHYNGIIVWQTGHFAEDIATFSPLGLDYYADVFPGESRTNELKSSTAVIDRLGGQFYWNEMYQAIAAGSTSMFVGMFDEFNEATAIMPMSDSAPPTEPYARFINNQGRPSNWWLQLTTAGKAMMLKQAPLTDTMP